MFHFKCLEKWVETKEVCPFCRGKIEFGKIIKKEDKKIEDRKIKKSDIHKDKEKNINYNSLFNKKTKFKKWYIIKYYYFSINYCIYSF